MKLVDYQDPRSLSSRLRMRRMRILTSLIDEIAAASPSRILTICDIGGTVTYWQLFPFQRYSSIHFTIDIYNLTYPNYDRSPNAVSTPNASFHTFVADATNLRRIKNLQYDLAHSNSVIEHLSGLQGARAMASETLRIAKYHFVQTPSFWFPLEPHVLLPLYPLIPRPLRWRLLMLLKGHTFEQGLTRDAGIWLLDKYLLRHLFPQSRIFTERVFGVPKSLIALSFVERHTVTPPARGNFPPSQPTRNTRQSEPADPAQVHRP
jgi:hypothetical protein